MRQQVPLGKPPSSAGWPTVIMYQGSFFSASLTWSASTLFPFGAYYQTMVVRCRHTAVHVCAVLYQRSLGVLGAPDGCGQVKNLLDDGFAVITPDAAFMGFSFYDTNLPPWYADRRGGLRTPSIDARTHAVTVQCVPARGFGIACTVQGHHDQPWAVAHRP